MQAYFNISSCIDKGVGNRTVVKVLGPLLADSSEGSFSPPCVPFSAPSAPTSVDCLDVAAAPDSALAALERGYGTHGEGVMCSL